MKKMAKLSFWFATALFAVGMAGCSDEDDNPGKEPSGYVTLTPKRLEFGFKGGEQVVSVKASAEDWKYELFGPEKAEGACRVVREGNTLKVSMDPNTDQSERHAEIVVSLAGASRVVSVHQDSPALHVDASRLFFDRMEHTKEITVSTDLDEWSYDYSETAEGSCRIVREGDVLKVTMTDNTREERSVIIEIKAGNMTRNVQIYQDRGFPAVRFSLPDFSEAPGQEGSKTLAYKVMEGDSVIAYVCNEWVPEYTLQTGKRATVIYTAKMNGISQLFAGKQRTDTLSNGGWVTETGGRYVSVYMIYPQLKEIRTEAVYIPGTPTSGSSYCIVNGRIVESADNEVEGTLVPCLLKDNDGNEYPIVKIGAFAWTRGTLRTRRYADGSAIATGLDDAAWAADRNGACCLYGFADANSSDPDAVRSRERNGLLYNHYVLGNAAKLEFDDFKVPNMNGWVLMTMAINALTGFDGESLINYVSTIARGYTEFDMELMGLLPVSEGNRNVDGSYGSINGASLQWSATAYIGKPRYAAFFALPDGKTRLEFLEKVTEPGNGCGIRLTSIDFFPVF